MSKQDDGGPAFPLEWEGFRGMSMRDWFAGQALAGMLSSNHFTPSGFGFEEFMAKKAFNMADAMLAARARKEIEE